MKITLLGTGTPTNPHRFQSAVLVEIGKSKLLFDAGRGAVHQMYQVGVAINCVNPIFITHHHFDHINDLFDVIISSAMQGRKQELAIYGPAGTKKIVHALLEQVWESNPEVESNVVEMTMANLRKKLVLMGSDLEIKNMRNAGYWLEE